MKVITPINILPAMVTSSTATEPRTSPSAFNAATAYTVGDLAYDTATFIVYQALVSNTGNVPAISPLYWDFAGYIEPAYNGGSTYAANQTVSYNHRVYQSLAGGNIGHQPDISTAQWNDVGPTNQYGMFDLLRNTPTISASPLVIVLTPGKRFTSFAALGLIADTIEVKMVSGVTTIYDHVANLSTRVGVIDGLTYFFNPFSTKAEEVAFDCPLDSTAVTTITLTRATGLVSIGSFVIGNYTYIGAIQYGPSDDADNYSTITRDSFGNSELIPRRSVPKLNPTVWANIASVPAIRALRETLNAVPAVWCGIDDNTSGYFESLLVLGVYKQFTINIAYVDTAVLELEIEEV